MTLARTITWTLPALIVAGGASPSIGRAAEPSYDLNLNFGGLVAMVAKTAAESNSTIQSPNTHGEFWILAPRGEDRDELIAASLRARNAGSWPVHRPNALHHVFMRVFIRDLIRGQCPEGTADGCDATAAAIPEAAQTWLPLGAADLFRPRPKDRARYDLVVDALHTATSGVKLSDLEGVEVVSDGNGRPVKACSGCTSFLDDAPANYAPPKSGVEDFAVPLGFRAGFRNGESVEVLSDRIIVTVAGVSGVTRLRLYAQGTATLQHTISLRPAKGTALNVDIVNVPANDLLVAPEDDTISKAEQLLYCLHPPRLDHFRLLYLLSPKPGGKYVYDYASYYAPLVKPQKEWCQHIPTTADPFCTHVGQMKPPPAP